MKGKEEYIMEVCHPQRKVIEGNNVIYRIKGNDLEKIFNELEECEKGNIVNFYVKLNKNGENIRSFNLSDYFKEGIKIKGKEFKGKVKDKGVKEGKEFKIIDKVKGLDLIYDNSFVNYMKKYQLRERSKVVDMNFRNNNGDIVKGHKCVDKLRKGNEFKDVYMFMYEDNNDHKVHVKVFKQDFNKDDLKNFFYQYEKSKSNNKKMNNKKRKMVEMSR